MASKTMKNRMRATRKKRVLKSSRMTVRSLSGSPVMRMMNSIRMMKDNSTRIRRFHAGNQHLNP